METQPETKPKKPFSPLVFRYFLLLFLVSFLLLGRLFWPFFSILILSFLLTGLFQPVFRFFHERLKFSGQFSSLVTCCLIIVVVFVPLMIFVVALSREVLGIYPLIKDKNLALLMQQLLEENQTVGRIKDIFAGFGLTFHPERVTQVLSEFGKVAGLFLYNQASSWAANIMHFVFSFFMMVIVIFFLLIDQERFISYILDLSPLPDQQERQLFRRFEEIAKAVLVGNGLCGLLQGFLGGVVFILLGIQFSDIMGRDHGHSCLSAYSRHRTGPGAGRFNSFSERKHGSRNFHAVFLCDSFLFGRVYLEALDGWRTGEDAYPARFSLYSGRAECLRCSGNYLWPVDRYDISAMADIYRNNYSEHVRKATC